MRRYSTKDETVIIQTKIYSTGLVFSIFLPPPTILLFSLQLLLKSYLPPFLIYSLYFIPIFVHCLSSQMYLRSLPFFSLSSFLSFILTSLFSFPSYSSPTYFLSSLFLSSIPSFLFYSFTSFTYTSPLHSSLFTFLFPFSS